MSFPAINITIFGNICPVCKKEITITAIRACDTVCVTLKCPGHMEVGIDLEIKELAELRRIISDYQRGESRNGKV